MKNEPQPVVSRANVKPKQSTPFKRSLVMTKPVKSSWKKKMEVKQRKLSIKALEEDMKAEKQIAIDLRKQRREENKRRREENAKKAEIVQRIKNLNKIGKKGAKRIRKV